MGNFHILNKNINLLYKQHSDHIESQTVYTYCSEGQQPKIKNIENSITIFLIFFFCFKKTGQYSIYVKVSFKPSINVFMK